MKSKRFLLLVFVFLVLVLVPSVGGYAWWSHTTQPDYRLREGQEALRNGDREAAERLAVRLEASGAKDHARLLRGQVLFQEAKPFLDSDQKDKATPLLQRCLDELNKIRDQGALRVQGAALIGQCLVYLKEPAQAERALLFVLAQDPDHIDAHRGLAVIYHDQGAQELATQHLKEVARLDPRDGKPCRLLGLIYKDQEQYNEAIHWYEEALLRDLSEWRKEEVHFELAECLVHQSNYEQAVPHLVACTHLTDQAADLLALRGECLRGLRQTGEAERTLDRALATYPHSLKLLLLRARLHEDAQQWPQAATLLERAANEAPRDYTCHFRLALVYQAMGRSADAVQQQALADELQGLLNQMNELNKTALARPWDAAVRQQLAEVCRKLGRDDQANLWLQSAAACAGAQKATAPHL
jgi:tetratricopeptide (TPR) repeat protein